MDLLDFIFKMSLSGSILFLIMFIFRPITKKIFSETWHYYMLVIMLLVFVLPIGSFITLPIMVEYKLPTPIETVNKITQNNKIFNIDQDNNKEIIQENNESKIIDKSGTNIKETKTSHQISTKEMVLYIWIVGVILFLIREMYFYKSFYKKLKNMSDEIQDDSHTYDILEICKKRLKINKRIIVKECSRIKSPMITGMFKVVITIPKMEYNENKLEMIFTHELIHYKRKDLVVKSIALIVNAINWFNLVAYIIRNSINVTCELSLDEQLVKNLDKSKRKYYGETILELIEYSQNGALVIGTSVCKSRRELETRLKKIVYFKKSRKLIVGISLIATILFTFTSVLAANNITSNATIKTTEFAVFVSNDGLYMSELKENNPILLDKNDKIELPIISRDGLYVAYTKNNSIYICNIKTHEIAEVAKNVESYDWNSSGNIIYSTKDVGMSMYNTNTKNSTSLINDEYNYYNIKCDSKNKIYANKKIEYTKDNEQYSKSIGIVSYDIDNNEEKDILESKEGNNKEFGEQFEISDLLESLGSTPNVSKVSSDDRYLYIWNKPHSGSMSADMTEFAVYDIFNNKFIANDNVIALANKDNISQNPVNSKVIAINNGEGREMYYNKTVGIFNSENNTFTNLIPEDQVSMMPDYSEDGKNIVYSGTNNFKNQKLKNFKEWFNQPHYIYQVNVDTKKLTQITNGEFCDFKPKYLLNNEILFERYDGNSCSLWKTKDGVETKLAEVICSDNWYEMDVFIG
jgi:bla regulator protein blaR1